MTLNNQSNDSELWLAIRAQYDKSFRAKDWPSEFTNKIMPLLQDEVLRARIAQLNSLITRLPANEFGEQKYVLTLRARTDILDVIDDLESQLTKSPKEKEDGRK